MKKRAIVLLVTIGFITVITALILRTVTLSKSSLDDLMSIKFQNQMILLMKDFTKVVDRFTADDFKKYFADKGAMPLSDEKSGLNLTISCISLGSRLDLNKLLRCNKKECDDFIRNYGKSLGLEDEEFFWALLKDSVVPLENERLAGSNISLEDKTFSIGDIVSFKTIQKIKDKYFQELRDKKIYEITKDKFLNVFYFSDINLTENNSSAPTDEISKLLGCYENDESCKKKFNQLKDKYKIKKSLKNKTKGRSNKINQTIQTNNLIQCSIKYYVDDIVHAIVFKYNLDKKSKKRVVSIDEFY